MEQVNILHKMAGYDFSAPINVTMIYEDSDDDSNLGPIIIDDDSSGTNADKVSPTELDTGKIKQESPYFEIAQYNKNIVEENELKEVKKENQVKERRTMDDNTINLDEDHKNNIQTNPPSVQESIKRTSNDPKVVHITEIEDKFNKQNDFNKQKSSQRHTNCTQNSLQTINFEKPNNTCQGINQYEQVPNNVNSLLENLSENLILIMDSYYQMERQLRSIQDASIRKKSQDAFLYIRRYFLDLSYETIDAVIVPQENNSSFVDSFLDNTVAMAINKKGIKCDRRHVYTFYKYMVQWAKLQKKRLSNLHQQNTLLKQYLNKPPMQYSAHSNVPIVNHCNIASPCIFSSGPLGRELTINVNTDALNDVNPANINASNMNAANVNAANMNAAYMNAANGNAANINAFQTQTCPIQYPGEHCNVNPRNALTYSHTNLELHGYNQPPKQKVPVRRKKQSKLKSLPQANQPPASKAPPPPYSMRPQNHFQNTSYYLQASGSLVQTKNQVDTTRSSVSRESGYASPSSVSPNVNPMDGVLQEQQTLLSPMISNVVSLSPRYQYSTIHGCHMCGKATEFRCRGCYTYYCSTICEQLDSQFHNAFCRGM